MKPSAFFSPADKKRVEDAVKLAELNTSGEVRVHLESRCKGDPLDRAAYLFEKLGMHKTQLRNGVLFYLAVDDHKFAILGDVGINQLTGEGFWNQISETMSQRFTLGGFAEGLSEGITMAGGQLKRYFPYMQDDVNELPDEISFG